MTSNEVANLTIFDNLFNEGEFLQLYEATLPAFSAHISTEIDQIWPILDHLTLKLWILVEKFGF